MYGLPRQLLTMLFSVYVIYLALTALFAHGFILPKMDSSSVTKTTTAVSQSTASNTALRSSLQILSTKFELNDPTVETQEVTTKILPTEKNYISLHLHLEILMKMLSHTMEQFGKRNIVPSVDRLELIYPQFKAQNIARDVPIYYQYLTSIQKIEDTTSFFIETYSDDLQELKAQLQICLCVLAIQQWCVPNSLIPKSSGEVSFSSEKINQYQYTVINTLTNLQKYVKDWNNIYTVASETIVLN